MTGEPAEVLGNGTQPEPNTIGIGGYMKEGFEAIKTANEQLAEKVAQTHTGDSHQFSEEELRAIYGILAKPGQGGQELGIDSSFATGFATARWRQEGKGVGVSAFREQAGKSPYQENIAAMFWHRFRGETPEEKDLKRLNFYLNMSKEEAEDYANENLVMKGESYKYAIR